MKLNVEKSKYMIFNFSKNYKINTRLYMENKLLQQVKETRLLGVILRDDLSFKSNTECITRSAYKRMVYIDLETFHYQLGEGPKKNLRNFGHMSKIGLPYLPSTLVWTFWNKKLLVIFTLFS